MIVLDCNAAFAISLGTEKGLALSALMLDGERAIAPQIIMAELSHVAAKYYRNGKLSYEETLDAAQGAIELVDEFTDGQTLWREATSEALRVKHSAYDLFYFVLARRNGATLFTLDQKLQNLCLDNGVDCVCTVDLN